MFANKLKYFDWPFFAAIIILSMVGLMMVYSTGLAGTLERNLWLKQTAALSLGLAGLFFFGTLDYRVFKKRSTWLYLLSLALLVGLLFFGLEVKGSARWFNLGLINFQPAEFSKLALIIVLAKFIQGRGLLLQKFRYVAWSFVYVLIPVVLVMLQPDFGSALIHVAIWFGLLLLSPMPRRYLLYLAVGFVVIAILAWQFILIDYQKDRIHSFLDPTADPLGRGYNVLQSTVAIGSGGFFGTGLARGLQSQLRFLPERQTDFIFASTVEELGLFGGGLVLILLAFVLWRLLRVVKFSRDRFGTLVAGGIFFMFLTQISVNVGMNLGLLPVTGITLPFLSYGGSSLVINFWLIGIAQNIWSQTAPVRGG